MCGIVAMVQLDGAPVDLPLLAHMAAVERLGASPEHRMSYVNVAAAHHRHRAGSRRTTETDRTATEGRR